MKRIPILFFARVLLGVLFAVSGFTKLLEPYQNFLSVIHTYGILAGAPGMWAARIIPWLELVGGVFLALGLWTRLASMGLWILNSAFIGVLTQALVRHLSLDECGCFGEWFKLKPEDMLKLDVGLWVLFLGLFIFKKQSMLWSLDSCFKKKD